jgi:tRNA threonylcarbamoyladenosine biosynthesis protein TsaB
VILAIDTATRTISVALATESELLTEETWQSENNHTIELAPTVAKVLAQNVQHLQAITVAIGPGSFTGVRIGLGFAKGLALARGLPLIGVPTLDITIRTLAPVEHNAIAVIQAGRGRVIWARYKVEEGNEIWRAVDNGAVGTWEVVAKSATESRSLVVGEVDEVGLKVLRESDVRVADSEKNIRRASQLAQIGWERWRAGRVDSAATLKPIYAHQPTSGS